MLATCIEILEETIDSFGDFEGKNLSDLDKKRIRVSSPKSQPRRKLSLVREPATFEEKDGVSISVPKNKCRDLSIEKIRKTLKGLASEYDYSLIITYGLDYEQFFESMPEDDSKLSLITRDELLSKLSSLHEKRNKFVSVASKASSKTNSKKALEDHARDVNKRMPVLSECVVRRLVDLYTQASNEALAFSPLSKPDAPLIRSHIDGISYSKSEPPKNHSLTRKARVKFDELTIYCITS